jgi:hypothetical protein
MDWKKVEELRKKVLAEEEALVQQAIKGDKMRKRVGPAVHHPKKASGVRNVEGEQERAVREWLGWDPNKAAKPLPDHMKKRQEKMRRK